LTTSSEFSSRIYHPVSRQDGVADKRVLQPPPLDDVGLPPEQDRELGSHLFPAAAPRAPVANPFLELDEDIDVAVGSKLFGTEDRSEEAKLPDSPLPTKLHDCIAV